MDTIHVLLVDDESVFLESLSERLSLRGLHVFTAPGGEEALQCLAASPELEVIVLDLRMPGLSGPETLARIKKDRPLVEVIMLTGQGDVESGVNSMKLGAFDFLQKPFETEELVKIIEKAAVQKRQHEDEVLLVHSTPHKMRGPVLEKVSPVVRKLFD